jgi:AcrR family transcriptional regulator
MTSTGQARRRYNADGRRAQARATRERILETARTLFIEQGYAGTSVAQIAAAAGVSAPTVFAGFSSKVNLLKEATESTLVGDADPVPLSERPPMRHVHEGRTAREVLERFAALIAEVAPRVCPIFAVVLAAADTDPEIARLARMLDDQRLVGATQIATTVLQRLAAAGAGDGSERSSSSGVGSSVVGGGGVGSSNVSGGGVGSSGVGSRGDSDRGRSVGDPARLAEIRDTLWTMNSPQLYGLLVEQRGWSPQRYGRWIERALVALIDPHESPR